MNGKGAELSLTRGMQKKNGKERAAGEEKLNCVCTKPEDGAVDIREQSSPMGPVGCTASVLNIGRAGPRTSESSRRLQGLSAVLYLN